MKHNSLIARYAIPWARRVLGDRIALPHLMAFLQYNSLGKTINLLRVLWEREMKLTRLKSKPFILFLEVNNLCNLRCPFCLTGKRKQIDRPLRNMSLFEMKRAIDDIADYLFFIQLYNWGEPLLNSDLFEFINYAHKKSIFTMASSNMNFVRETVAEQVVASGLDYLIAAIDGFSQDSYGKYRRGGDFKKAIHNLERVLEAKKKSSGSHPFIEWQYVVFRHNQHQIQEAREFANHIGVDYFHIIPGYIEDPEWITTIPEYQAQLGLPGSVNRCTRPWTHFNVRVDGGVAPCCYEFFKRDDFGNIFETDFHDIWNNHMFRSARDILITGTQKPPAIPDNICFRCMATGIRPSFEEVKDNE